jgi:hypothetical protein
VTTTQNHRDRFERRSSAAVIGLALALGLTVAAIPEPAHARGASCSLVFPVTTSKMRAAQQCLASRPTPVKEITVTARGIRWI